MADAVPAARRTGVADGPCGLARRLNYYGQRGLLVLDEPGYLSYDARAADLLF